VRQSPPLVRRLLLALLVLSGCVRAVREERRERPVDTGVAISFTAEGPRRWDFGDGQGAAGPEASHVFERAGRYDVRAFDGERLTDRVSVLVQPRDPFHAVAPSAEAVLVFRSLDELAPAVDFLERLASAATVQRALERTPVFAFALDPGSKGAGTLDRLEGAGLYLPRGLDAAVSFLGVVDGPGAERLFTQWLIDHEYRPDPERPGRLSIDGDLAEVFVDRGTLFMVTGSDWAVLSQASQRVREAPASGLEHDATFAAGISSLASGGVAVLATPALSSRARTASRGPPPRWSVGLAALRFSKNEARLAGKLLADGPLWTTPPASRPARLLAHAPDGPIGLLAADVPLAQVLSTFGVPLDEAGDEEGLFRAGLSVVSRRIDVALYFDVEAFLVATLAAKGRPTPRVTLLAEAAVPDRADVSRVVGQLLARRREPFDTATEKGTSLWRTRVLDTEPLELALDADTLYARLGRALAGHTPTDFVSTLGKRSEGACGPGHLTAFVDVGQLGRELLEPRMVPGLDPRRVVMTQALTSTFLSQLTAVDTVFLDAAPAPDGATVLLEVTLSPRQNEGPPP
jgi:hypothetical protein